MKKPQMGLHTQEERNMAYQRAKQAYEEAMKVSPESVMRAYHSGYLQAISDLAQDHGQEELAQLVRRLWLEAQGLSR